MDTLIEFGRGPLFRFAVAIAVLGLLRHAALSIWGLWRARRRAGDRRLALGQVIARTAGALNPLRYFVGNRWLYSILSVAFHVGLILVPVFLAGHVRLWRRGLGIGWPALPMGVADALTLVTLTTGVLLLVARAWSEASRRLSRPQDWLLPPLIVIAFGSGYLLVHPARSPFDPSFTMLVHVWVADLLLLLTPFTKLAHCALLPFSQLVSEMAWRLVPGAGQAVHKTLGKEGQPI
jgi:nitrate reductase gamma subunit